MKATGIVRRIDDLGRVVIPKEIRRTLMIREGDPLEIYTGTEGEVVLKKYSPMGEIHQNAMRLVQVLTKQAKALAIITDKDQVIAVAGNKKSLYEQKGISKELEKAIRDRARYNTKRGQTLFIPVIEDDPTEANEQIICTILSQGDAIGAIILYGAEMDKFGEIEQRLALCCADFLGCQLEL